eukprot:CAMPEP_0177774706 /NCGR_PEP_ID=MMETSP0491_2-20121128/13677_1 /TAXON_ID=63592 /ORGANISM="Tetraselmis chuii, Strain PLY429" /LENGTH=1240 /DNA_ID=CAMNT_0019293157 /DNA_START=192 /DNA_END=3910 /DNA_ORIENTATION=-
MKLAFVAVVLVLAAPTAVVTEGIDLSSYFDERLAEPLSALTTSLNTALRSFPSSAQQALSPQVANVSTAINSIILDACESSGTIAGNDKATQQIEREIRTLVTFIVSELPDGVDSGLFSVEAVKSAFRLDELCPFLSSSCSGGEDDCEMVGALQEDSAAGEGTLTATGKTTRISGNTTCIGENCSGNNSSDAWRCPGDTVAETALVAACGTNPAFLSAVKAGEAPTLMLFATSPDIIASTTCAEGCLAAVAASACVSNETIAMVMAVCGCYDALDAACQAPLRGFLPTLLSTSNSELDLGNVSTIPEDPQMQAVTDCQSKLLEKEECALLIPMTSLQCCIADFVNSGCLGVMAELPEGTDGGDVDDTALGMAAMPDSVVAVGEAFSNEGDGAALTSEQRVAVLRDASINRLAEFVMVPLTDWCVMAKLNTPSFEMLQCCHKLQTCQQASSMSDGMVPGQEQGGMLPGNIDGDAVTADMVESCEKIETECFPTTMDVCLTGSVEDFIALAEVTLLSEDETGATRRMLQDDSEPHDPVSEVSDILRRVISGAAWSLSSLDDDARGMLNRVAGPLCTSFCSTRLASCDAASVIPSLNLVAPGSRLCRLVTAPLFSFGDKQRALRVSATLGLPTVGDFTDELRLQFLEDLAAVANVPVVVANVPGDQVSVTVFEAGGVVVNSVVVVKAETDTAADAYAADLKAILADPTAVFRSDVFGNVALQVADTVVANLSEDAWECPGDAEAEAALRGACPNMNLTMMSAVKAGGASTLALFASSPETIASTCAEEACLAAVDASTCLSAESTAMVMAMCGCHDALDTTCQASLRGFLPTMFGTLGSGLDLGNAATIAENPEVLSVVSVAEPFCTVCQPTLLEKEECAILMPKKSLPCCLADFVNSGCADVMAELAQVPDGEDVNDPAVGMAILPDSMVALSEAFPNAGGGAALTPEQRVAALRDASITRLTEVVTVPLTDWCDMVKPDSPSLEVLQCGQKMQICLASSIFGGVEPALGEEQGSIIPSSIENILPADMVESCEKIETDCFDTTINVCLGGSVEDFVALADVTADVEDATDESDTDDPLTTVSLILRRVISGAAWSLSSLGEDGREVLDRVAGPMCTPACAARLASCDAASIIPSLKAISEPDSTDRTRLCKLVRDPVYSFGGQRRLVKISVTLGLAIVEDPVYSFGDQRRLVKISATLGLAIVEDFTDALRFVFVQNLAVAAHVPAEQVSISSIEAGSVVV